MRVTTPTITTGTTLGGVAVGGFFKVLRFAISDPAPVSGARMFCGVQAGSLLTNTEPASQTDCIGVGHGAADSNLKLFYGGSVAQTPLDLGANYPITAGSAYELVLYCPAGSSTITWQVTRLDTIITPASGTLSGAAGTVLPAPTTFLNYSWNWRCNNAASLSVTLDLISDYIETD